MIDIEIQYDGKTYDDIEDAEVQGVLDEVRDHIQEQLEEFEEEINQHDGGVKVDISHRSDQAKVSFHSLPDDLVERIKASLQ